MFQDVQPHEITGNVVRADHGDLLLRDYLEWVEVIGVFVVVVPDVIRNDRHDEVTLIPLDVSEASIHVGYPQGAVDLSQSRQCELEKLVEGPSEVSREDWYSALLMNDVENYLLLEGTEADHGFYLSGVLEQLSKVLNSNCQPCSTETASLSRQKKD